MNRIKEVIALSGLRKNWIANQIGVHPSHISMWIGEERHPNKARIRALCKLLGCKVKDLYPQGINKKGNQNEK